MPLLLPKADACIHRYAQILFYYTYETMTQAPLSNDENEAARNSSNLDCHSPLNQVAMPLLSRATISAIAARDQGIFTFYNLTNQLRQMRLDSNRTQVSLHGVE